MKQRIRTFVAGLLLALALHGVAAAGPLEDGRAAWWRGDYAEAMRFWHPLAEQGNVEAQYQISLLYLMGSGVPQDYPQALAWCRRAAEQGYPYAQGQLGEMYEKGEGVPQDYVLAHMWLNLAAAQGTQSARSERDELAAKMTPEQIAEAQRLAREWKPKPGAP